MSDGVRLHSVPIEDHPSESERPSPVFFCSRVSFLQSNLYSREFALCPSRIPSNIYSRHIFLFTHPSRSFPNTCVSCWDHSFNYDLVPNAECLPSSFFCFIRVPLTSASSYVLKYVSVTSPAVLYYYISIFCERRCWKICRKKSQTKIQRDITPLSGQHANCFAARVHGKLTPDPVAQDHGTGDRLPTILQHQRPL